MRGVMASAAAYLTSSSDMSASTTTQSFSSIGTSRVSPVLDISCEGHGIVPNAYVH